MATIRELEGEGRQRLADSRIQSPGREARLLLGAILDRPEVELLAHDELEVGAAEGAAFLELVARRGRGEPFAYLVGCREFYGRPFRVDDRVLIPRPETENLVEIALALPLPERARVVDIGTGSGAIALSLAAERPDWRVVATDLSPGALACARDNARRLGLSGRTTLVCGAMAEPLDLSRFDLVVSNPPYIDAEDEKLLADDVRAFEPSVALFSAGRGLALIEQLLDATRALRPGAWVTFEFGFGQHEEILDRAAARPWLELVRVHEDLAGIPRDVVFKRRSEETER